MADAGEGLRCLKLPDLTGRDVSVEVACSEGAARWDESREKLIEHLKSKNGESGRVTVVRSRGEKTRFLVGDEEVPELRIYPPLEEDRAPEASSDGREPSAARDPEFSRKKASEEKTLVSLFYRAVLAEILCAKAENYRMVLGALCSLGAFASFAVFLFFLEIGELRLTLVFLVFLLFSVVSTLTAYYSASVFRAALDRAFKIEDEIEFLLVSLKKGTATMIEKETLERLERGSSRVLEAALAFRCSKRDFAIFCETAELKAKNADQRTEFLAGEKGRSSFI